MITDAQRQFANRLLKRFDQPETTLDEGILYLHDGLSIEARECVRTVQTIGGERQEPGVEYVLMGTYTEYNYPHEPDYTDVADIESFERFDAALKASLLLPLEWAIDNWLQAEAQYELFA